MDKNLAKPLVSVILSVYNADRYVEQAVDSILGKNFKNFELIIIDDGSTDDTAKVLAAYKDPRIQVIRQENKGLVASLNSGIAAARGTFIARQDADDVSDPQRIGKQVSFLQKNPDVVLIGSSIKVMDEAGEILHEHRVLLHDAELKQELLVRSPFAHGSVMFRKDAFDKTEGYEQAEWPAEDYGLWLRMAAFGEFANIDEPLYMYREYSQSISAQNQEQQLKKRDELRVAAWRVRKEFLSKKIRTADYLNLEMGQFRIERIAHNLLFSLRKGLRKAELFTVCKSMLLLLQDAALRRKCARLVLVKLRLKRA